MLCLTLQILATTYIVSVIPESPKWLYTWENFDESREVLSFVARFNAVTPEVLEN